MIEKDITQKESPLNKEEEIQIKKLFEEIIDNKNHTYTIAVLENKDLPLMVNLSEDMQRMQYMSENNGLSNFMQKANEVPYTITININHPIIKKILSINDTIVQKTIVQHLYDLALLTQNKLQGNALTQFIERSIQWMNKD